VVTPLTVHLDDEDFALLTRVASELGIRPGTLAEVLIHRSLRPADQTQRQKTVQEERTVDAGRAVDVGEDRNAGCESLRALVRLTADLPPVDTLAVANTARNDIEDR
jgi:spore coat polysaccharide biosynthesis protein SpsF (cytidylyltransferase family)